jgi:diguanylate cyclase (GGDEF)-like protein
MPAETSWSTQQLIEFLASITALTDEESAIREGVQRAAEALEAEVGALVGADSVYSVGFPRDQTPEQTLREASASSVATLDIAGLGTAMTIAAPFDDLPGGRLMVARVSDLPFLASEAALLRGMGRVLGLAIRSLRVLAAERSLRRESEQQAAENARLLSSLRDRQELLERLTRIQRSIASRAPLEDVLAAIVAGAAELLGDEIVGLRRIDPADPQTLELLASFGLDEELRAQCARTGIHEGAGGRAVALNQLVVEHDYQSAADPVQPVAKAGVTAAMAAPVHADGKVVGSMTVASLQPGRVYLPVEQEILTAFAEHTSLALTDARTVEELRYALSTARYDALHDGLTALPNRAMLHAHLEKVLRRARRQRTGVAVLFLDLDGFKHVNDSLGHTVGDRLLVAVAHRLRGCLRDEDVIARLGGDEFAIVLSHLEDAAEAERVALRLIDSLRDPFSLPPREITIAASIGVTAAGAGPEELLRNADLAMYEAKASGKGCFRWFEAGMHAQSIARLELEGALRQALAQRDIQTHYQPIVALHSGQVSGVEALARWTHPQRGDVPPSDFIPLAETVGLIAPLGEYMLEQACLQARRWADLDPAALPPTVSVNISPAQLGPQLAASVSHALDAGGLAAQNLIVEITETALRPNVTDPVSYLADLRSLGVRLSIDDFGTGYSSLSRLADFPLDQLKIDRSLVAGMAGRGRGRALVAGVIGLGKSLGLTVVAEGVETAEQSAQLVRMGCDYAQGFGVGRPSPPAALDHLFAPGSRSDVRPESHQLASAG